MRAHPIADLLPLLDGEEFRALVADIAAHGLREPITLTPDGLILDGRNRYAACLAAKVEPRTVAYDGDPLAFVVSENITRRHLSESQRAMFGARLANMNHGGDRRSEQAADLPLVSQSVAAARLNVSERLVRDAVAVQREAPPETIAAVDRGEIAVSRAIQDIQRTKMFANLASLETQEAKAIEGVYDVVVIDPPWPMQKIERDVRPNQVGLDYPTMTEDELAALTIPCADAAHVWLWTTNKHLPLALRLLEAWGLKYVCTFVWHKPGGPQPLNLPQYNCEFALYAHRGAPQFTDTKAFNLCFNAPRGGHSEKPEEFYAMVRRVTAGRRIDMFGRRAIEGFQSWGKEAPRE